MECSKLLSTSCNLPTYLVNKGDDSIPDSLLNSANYYKEETRLKTFVAWPSQSPVNPARLAKSGFYYTGTKDEVMCFSCNGCIGNWQYGDIVHKRHMQLYPHCDFINKKSNNVPIKQSITSMKDSKITTESKYLENDLLTSRYSNDNIHCDTDYSVTSINNRCNSGEGETNITPSTMTEPIIIDFKKMASVDERLKTYNFNWPLPLLNVLELATAGFFYLGYRDKVQCAYCHGIVKNWEVNDIPLHEHIRHFPHCSYAQQLQVKSGLDSDGKGHDVCGYLDTPVSLSVKNPELQQIQDMHQHTRLNELGINLHNIPAHPQLVTLSARLQTFATWPKTCPTKEELAAAGFFYIGDEDHTKCFHCDGGLCSWQSNDQPWIEHARWYTGCSFVKLNKGERFIKECVEELCPLTACELKMASNLNVRLHPIDTSNSHSMSKFEDTMKSSLISALLEKNVFPSDLIRAAVFHRLNGDKVPFSNIDEVHEAVNLLKERLDSNCNTRNELESKGMAFHSQNFSALNSVKTPDESMDLQPENKDSKFENQLLRDQRLCRVCMDNDVTVVFLPCGHLLVCATCAPALNYCPVCREFIQATVRAYLP